MEEGGWKELIGFGRGRSGRTEALANQIKVTLDSGDREGGVLTCYLSRESKHACPFLPGSLKGGREGRTAKGTMMFKHKNSISVIAHVE